MSLIALLQTLGNLLGGFVQPTLALIAVALSVFSLIIYLWLGMTVLLMGNRASLITWAGGVGLLCGALFFLCHGALVGSGVPNGPAPADFWWRLSWIPGFAAPLFWAAIGLHYAGLAGAWRRLRIPALLTVAAFGALAVALAMFSWPALAQYGDFIRLLDASLRLQGAPAHATISPALPFLGVAFVIYVAACACLPWASLAARRFLPLLPHGQRRAGATSADSALLWDSTDAWGRARPALLMASLLIILTGAVVATIGVLLALAEHRALLGDFSRDIGDLPVSVPTTLPGHAPLLLVIADVCVQGPLAGVGLMVGWAVVRQGVLVERRLPQQGFLSHWRVMAGLAAIFAAVVAWMSALLAEALPDLLLLVALVAVAYALLTWQSYMAHDRLLTQLRPFVASLAVGHTGWLATDPSAVESSVEALFTSLCRDVLGAASGTLSVSAGRLSRSFSYTAPWALAHGGAHRIAPDARIVQREHTDTPPRRELWKIQKFWKIRNKRLIKIARVISLLWRHESIAPRAWTLPVNDERGVVARMTFGPRLDGAGYTSADVEVARACGQRILDAVGEFAAAQAVASLARRRGLEAELSAALPRRVLHDDVLPRLHLAILRIETLRARLTQAAQPAATPTTVNIANIGFQSAEDEAATLEGAGFGATLAIASEALAAPAETQEIAADLGAVAHNLSHAHHDLAALMRAAPMASPRRMEHGFTGALRGSLDGEFRGVFDTLDWDTPAAAVAAADALPPIVADLLLSATLEAVRNAGRHARGSDLHRPLTLEVHLAAAPEWVEIRVRDNGVGLQRAQPAILETADGEASESAPIPPMSSQTAGARSGLLTHGALMSLVGGSLTVHSEQGDGATVSIRAPRSIAE